MNESKLLLLFLDVVDQGSFVGAAKIREIDPGQVSRQIKTLETQLNTVLLNRSTRSLSLTDVGEKIYEKARQIKTVLDEINSISVGYQQTIQGTIRLTAPTYLGRHFVEPAISTLSAKYSNLHFELLLDDMPADIINEGYDVAIRQWQPRESNLVATRLRDVQPRIVASPGFIETYGRPETVGALVRLPASTYQRKGLVRDTWQHFDKDHQLVVEQFNSHFKTNDAELMVRSVLAGRTYSLLADYMVEGYLQSGELVELLPELVLPPDYSVYAVYPHRHITCGTRRLVEILKENLA